MVLIMAFQIISDGSCDLGTERVAKEGVRVVPFYVSFDDKTYQKEIEEVSVREFYQRMVDNADCFPKSSLPSVQDYLDVFEEYAAEERIYYAFALLPNSAVPIIRRSMPKRCSWKSILISKLKCWIPRWIPFCRDFSCWRSAGCSRRAGVLKIR